MNFDTFWKSVFLGIFAAFLLFIVGILWFNLFAPHKIEYYYVGQRKNSDIQMTCVYVSIDNAPDETIFCSIDNEKTTDFVYKSNKAIGVVK